MSSKSRRRLRNKLFEQQEGRCFYCDGEMHYASAGPLGATLDHVIPRSDGGSTHWVNAVAAHQICNRGKGDRQPTLEELLRLIRMKSMEPA